MEFKESKYNYKVNDNKNLVIFNSRSKKMIKIEKNIETVLDIIENPNDIKHSESMKLELASDGIIVPNNVDEDQITNLNFIEYIMDNELSLTILPTEQCNFRCPYCYEEFKNNNMSKDSEFIIEKFIKKNISKYSKLDISWFGGEPLLKIDTINNLSEKLIEICSKMKKPYSSSITTNGYYLDLDTFNMLIKNKVTSIQVTLDGPKEVHDSTKFLANGNGSFDKVVDNLRCIRDNAKTSHFSLVIRTNVTKDTLDVFSDYVKFLCDEFGNDPRFNFFFRPVGNWGGERVQSIEDKLLYNFDEVYDILAKQGEPLNNSVYYNLLRNGMCYANKRNSFTITPNLDVFKCTMLFECDENKIGKIDASGKMILDEYKHSNWIVKKSKDMKDDCMSCKLLPVCHDTNCPAKHVLSSESIQCGYELHDIDNIIKLISNDKDSITNKYVKIY